MNRENEYERIWDADAGSDAKREVRHICFWQEDGKRAGGVKMLLIGISQTGVRIRYPEGTRSPVRYLPEPSQEFQSLAALWVCSLVPTGIYADALEEAYGNEKEIADFLRFCEQRKQEIES